MNINYSEEIEGHTLYIEPRDMYDLSIIKIEQGVVSYSVANILLLLKDSFTEYLMCDLGPQTMDDVQVEEQAYIMAIEWFYTNIESAFLGEYSPQFIF